MNGPALNNVNVIFVTIEQHKEEENFMSGRFLKDKPINEKHKLNTFLRANIFSYSTESEEYNILSTLEDAILDLKDTHGFVTFVYGSSLRLDCVLSVDENTSQVKICFLQTHGHPSPS